MRTFKVRINGELYEVEVEEVGQGPAEKTGQPVAKEAVTEKKAPPPAPKKQEGETEVTAPMPGVILDIKVEQGGPVEMGKAVVVLEAMKMENEIPAPVSGTVKTIKVSKGQSVNTGDVLVIIG